MEYRIFQADSAEELERDVRVAIGQGWKPLGGVSCSYGIDHTHIDHHVRGDRHAINSVFHELWAQAMVKE